MALHQNHQQAIIDWGNKHQQRNVCPICDSKHWECRGLLDLSEADSSVVPQGTPALVVLFVCAACGLCRFVAADKMGLPPPTP
jgi:hypothetical protein